MLVNEMIGKTTLMALAVTPRALVLALVTGVGGSGGTRRRCDAQRHRAPKDGEGSRRLSAVFALLPIFPSVASPPPLVRRSTGRPGKGIAGGTENHGSTCGVHPWEVGMSAFLKDLFLRFILAFLF